MDPDTEYDTTEPFSTNAEVVGSAPAVSIANYMLSISAALSRSAADSVNQQQVNNMTSLAAASQGAASLLSLSGKKQELSDMLGLVQQLTARE